MNEIFTSVRDSRTSVAFQMFDEVSRKYWDLSADLAEVGDDDKVIVVMRDITRLVELQESVRRGEQLSAMGELVAGVAHEVRNPLFGIGATIETMQMTLGEVDADTNMLFDALRQWVRRLSSLMEQLLEYGKAWSVNLQKGDVEDVIQQAIDISQGLAEGADVTLEFVRSKEKASILLDPARLLQVFQNLVMNAIQHSPPGETVTITSDLIAGREVRCSVRDRGPGFAMKDVGKIFQPFYTTRRGGTGLGLSIVQRVVDEHGGTIDAQNHPNGGAFVQVHFPITEKANS
jgi:signal transduction histidine kinase